MVLVPFTGVPKEDTPIADLLNEEKSMRQRSVEKLRAKNKEDKGLSDPTLHRDVCYLFRRYLKLDGLVDIAANVPILVYMIINGVPHTPEEVEAADADLVFRWLMILKTLRLYHAQALTLALKRLFDKLGDIFFLKAYIFQNLLSWMLASLKLFFTVHYFACGWILIAHAKEKSELPFV